MTRSKAQMIAAKKILKQPAGKLEPVNLTDRPHPEWMTRCFMNNRYVVMINDYTQMTGGVVAIRAMVQRHDDKPILGHWREMQSIKNELFGRESLAIEYYPPESLLCDVANIYWLYVFKQGEIPEALNARGGDG